MRFFIVVFFVESIKSNDVLIVFLLVSFSDGELSANLTVPRIRLRSHAFSSKRVGVEFLVELRGDRQNESC